MKAVVVQITGRQAVLLTEQGTFVKAADRGYRVGQQIPFMAEKKRTLRPLLIAASLVIFFLGTAGLAADRVPVSYISLDVNPSMEFSLNWFDRVLSVEAVNEDAEPIVQQLIKEGVVSRPMDAAFAMALKSLDDSHYFTEDGKNDVVIAAASYGIKDVRGLAGRLGGSTQNLNMDKPLSVTAIDTDISKVEAAKQHHTTAGKLILAEEAAASPEDSGGTTVEDWLKKPVREILQRKQGQTQGQNMGESHGRKNGEEDQPGENNPASLILPTPSPSGEGDAKGHGTFPYAKPQGTYEPQTTKGPGKQAPHTPVIKNTPGAQKTKVPGQNHRAYTPLPEPDAEEGTSSGSGGKQLPSQAGGGKGNEQQPEKNKNGQDTSQGKN